MVEDEAKKRRRDRVSFDMIDLRETGYKKGEVREMVSDAEVAHQDKGDETRDVTEETRRRRAF